MNRSLFTRRSLGVLLIIAAAVLAVLAAWLIYSPAGIAVAALVAFCAGYVLLYMEARNAIARQPDASS